MKRKFLLLVLVIFLILALTGCKIIPPCCTEGMRAKQEVYSYWQAIINREYELAKWYCVPDGVWYNKTDEWEEYINFNSEDEALVLIYLHPFSEKAEVIGDNAIVYATVSVRKMDLPGNCVEEVDTFEYEIELIKETSPPTNWKLK
ncbi:hypothetical protein ES704_01023 [subsurface metagenome]|jgi:hypothetical protein